MQMCQTPALCAEATIQPLRRYPDLDAVVIFSDILIVLQAIGLEVRMEPGPVLPAPLVDPSDLSRLNLKPDADAAFSYLYEGISLTRRLSSEIRAVPVLGFCGGPWTLMAYAIDSGAPPPAPSTAAAAAPAAAPAAKEKGHEKSKSWLYTHPEASHALLSALADVCVELLVGQWRAGANALQVFESNAGELPPYLFTEFALQYLKRIAAGVRARVPSVSAGGPPLIVFPRNAHSPAILRALCDSAYDAISLDWATDMGEATALIREECARLGVPVKAVQGNLDPTVLFAPPAVIAKETKRMLVAAGDHPIIANLGHGMLPSHTPKALGVFFEGVHAISADLRAGGSGDVSVTGRMVEPAAPSQ